MMTRRSWLSPLLLDVAAWTASFYLACLLLPWLERILSLAYQSPGIVDLWPGMLASSVLMLPLLFLFDGYSIPRHWTWVRLLRSIAVCMASLVTGYLVLTIVYPEYFASSRKAVVVGAFIATLILCYWRQAYPELYGRADRRRRAVLVGAHTFAIRALQRFARDHADALEIIGVVDDFRGGDYFENLGVERCGGSPQLRTILRTRPIDTVIVLTDQSQYADKIIDLLDETPTVREVFVRAQVPLSVAQDIDLLFAQEVPLLKVYSAEGRQRGLWLKSMIDRALAAIALLLAAPIFLVVPILIVLESRGPILYRQRRLGRDNKPFWICKFRSMVVDAEKASGAVLAQKNDPRVTRVGRILRVLRLDEVPQLFNVLRGEMSMIGPRPERPEFQNIYRETIPWYSLRSMHKPGITGLAQVSGDYHTSAQRKLLYDVTYLANMGLLLDLRILLATVLTVLTKKGH